VRGDALFKCRDGWTPRSHNSRPPHLIPPGEAGFSIPRVRPALVPDSGPNKRVCFVLDLPSGRQSNADPNEPVTGHWAVRDLVARPIGEPLAPIPKLIEPLETIEEMEIGDTSPEDSFALPQPVVPIQTMQQHLDSFQMYSDERRAQDEANARLADFELQCVTLPLTSILLFLFPLNKQNHVCPLCALLPFFLYLAHCIVIAKGRSLHYQTLNM